MKRFVSVFLAVLMVFGCIAIGAGAASKGGKYIYFDAGEWKDSSYVFAHIWVPGGDSFFSWQANNEKCEKVEGDLWRYDLTKLDSSTKINGGFDDKRDYLLIFSDNYGRQTFDLTFGAACVEDKARITGEHLENPIDSAKYAAQVEWSKNSKSYGPHITITSIGNIVGSYYLPGEKADDIFTKWLCFYYNSPNIPDIKGTVANLISQLRIKSIDLIYSKVRSILSDDDTEPIKKLLEDAYAEVATRECFYFNTAKKTLYIGEAYTLTPVLTADLKEAITFKSQNKKIAVVNAKGKIVAKAAGKTTITATSGNTLKKFTVTVKKPIIKLSKTSLKLKKSKTAVLKASIAPKGGKVTWSSSNSKLVTVSKSGKIKAKKAGAAKITAKLTYKGKAYKVVCNVRVTK